MTKEEFREIEILIDGLSAITEHETTRERCNNALAVLKREKQLLLHNVMQWVAINRQEPPFDKKILTWNENEPNEPSRTDTLVAIEHNSKGKLYKWLENGYPTHWMHLPKRPCA